KQPHDDPTAQSLFLGTEFTDDIVRIANNTQPLTLAQVVVQFPEGEILSPSYHCWPLRQRLPQKLHDALVIAHQTLPIIVESTARFGENVYIMVSVACFFLPVPTVFT